MPGTNLTMTTSNGVNLIYADKGYGRPVLLLDGYSGRRASLELCTSSGLGRRRRPSETLGSTIGPAAGDGDWSAARASERH